MWRQVEYFACRKLSNPFRKNFTPNRLFHSSRALFNHYKTLGVDQNADEKAIKQAFFKQAKKWHPDQNPDDPDSEKKFKEINEAPIKYFQTKTNARSTICLELLQIMGIPGHKGLEAKDLKG
jgi:hypothetical protein